MNEEFDNTYGKPNAAGYENINAYNQIFVDTVRQPGGNNGKRWLLSPAGIQISTIRRETTDLKFPKIRTSKPTEKGLWYLFTIMTRTISPLTKI